MATLILTACVYINNSKSCIHQTNSTDRINTYVKSVQQWLNNTNFPIILVENSGYSFPELAADVEKYKGRFEIISFKESNIPAIKNIMTNHSKGVSEMFAINYAFFNTKLPITTPFIIKITGRFFIPELSNFLSKYNLNDYYCITQHNSDRCELVGCHVNYFFCIFGMNIRYSYIEAEWKNRTSVFRRHIVCPEFKIDPTPRGGVNEIYHTI